MEAERERLLADIEDLANQLEVKEAEIRSAKVNGGRWHFAEARHLEKLVISRPCCMSLLGVQPSH